MVLGVGRGCMTQGAGRDADAVAEKVVTLANVAPYLPGQFFLRELPCLLAVLKSLPPVSIVLPSIQSEDHLHMKPPRRDAGRSDPGLPDG